MDLETLNPKVHQMWLEQKMAGPDYFQPSTEEDIAEIEREVAAQLPLDYKEFLLEYSTVIAAPVIGAYFFKVEYNDKRIIECDFTLVPWARLTLGAVRVLHKPHRTMAGVGPRVPKELLPLTYDNESTLLLDLRAKTFGHVLYLPKIKRQTFGTLGYGWEQVGFVASSFTDFLTDLDTEENQVAKYGLPNR